MRKLILMGCAVAAFGSAIAQKPKTDYPIGQRLSSYKTFTLTTDTTALTTAEKTCLVHLIKAAEQADRIFWKQTYMDKDQALSGIKNDTLKRFMELNYGPWDRLNNNESFVKGVGDKPLGANFYPPVFSTEGIDSVFYTDIFSPYTVVRPFNPQMPKPEGEKGKGEPKQGEGLGAGNNMPPDHEMQGSAGFGFGLQPIPSTSGSMIATQRFGTLYEKEVFKMVDELNKAAEAIEAEDRDFAMFLRERAGAMMSDEYIHSDVRWLELRSHLDIIIGPIENYEDKLYGAKTSYEAYVLIRDLEWGKKLDKFVAMLPELQAGIPVDPAYKPAIAGPSEPELDEMGNPMPPQDLGPIEKPGFPPIPRPESPMSQLAVFDVVYYGGDCNAGSKTIAVNLPNDETLQTYFGTRRSQLKNAMRAKFEYMVVPISKELINPKQRKYIDFNGFFSNVMFHEVAHGLGVKNLVTDSNITCREALGPNYSAIEECKADVLGLYMVTQLWEKGELEGDLENYYITFVASVFRSVRFGAASAHGKANMITFNTLMNSGAIVRDSKGSYSVDMKAMRSAIDKLAAELLTLQGDGNAQGVQAMLDTRAKVSDALMQDLARLEKANIPVDLVFDQGVDTLGLGHYYEEPQNGGPAMPGQEPGNGPQQGNGQQPSNGQRP